MSHPPLLPAPHPHSTHTHNYRSQRRQRLPTGLYHRQRRQRKSRNNNNYVVNLSSKTLTRDTINLLSKGLGYAPVPAPPNRTGLNEDLEAFARRLRIAHRFRNSRRQGKKHPFKPKSQWAPPRASNPALEEYIEKTLAEEPEQKTPKPNLSRNEMKILLELGKNKDLVIKKADKGSCIVVQDRSTYVEEGKSHLADLSTYRPLDSDPTASIAKGIGEVVDSMKEAGYIDTYTHAYLYPSDRVRTQRMYFLKKLHKTPHGIRPIVSGCSGPTERVSSFLDHIIKPLVPTTPSYIKDSPHLISLIENTPIPNDAILATIDVSSLYTNIPQNEGTEACLDAIEAAEASLIPRNVLRKLFEIVLRCNVFSFDGQIYEQIQGTAMGTKMAPSYANLFMDRFEKAFLAQEPIQPLLWKRYIDDILCIWTGTRSELDSFLDRLNKAHRTLRFTWSISSERVEFLDLNLFKGGRFNTTNHLDMSTHFKKTNTFQYLHFSSSHPRSVFKGLVKGEAIRFLRSNTDAHTFYSTLHKFRGHLLLRKYPRDFVNRILDGITHDLRTSYIPSLSPSPSPSPSPAPSPSPTTIPRLVTTYSPHYTRLLQLLKQHWSLVQNDPSLSALFPTPPQLCYRRNPTLADTLVKAALPGSNRPTRGQVPPIPITRLDSRMMRCADKRCKVCPRAEGRCVLFSTVSNTPYTFHETFTCTDTSLIYCIVCNKCGKLYIGLTSNSLKVRFRAHRHFSETKRRVPLYRHFARKSHDFLRDHRIVPLEHCHPDALPEREAYWIRTLHTLIPHGLNSIYGKPYYPYDRTVFSLSLSSTDPPPPRTPPRDTDSSPLTAFTAISPQRHVTAHTLASAHTRGC